MQAIINKDDAMVELLLKSKADVNQRDNNKWTPLMHAAQSGTLRLVKVLLDAGADKSLALPIAVRNRHKEIVKELISRGHNVNVILNDDDTPLMLAITNKDDAMMELLLEAKADVNQKGKKRTPLLYAAESGCEAIVDLLLKYKAEWDEEAVIKAAKNGHIALVSKLLGFAPMERRKLLATIFDIALTNGSLELASRLLALYVVLSGQSLPKYTHITPLRYFGEQEVDLKMARFFGDKETIAELETQSKVRTELEALITLCKTREIQDYLSKKPGVKATVKAHLESAKYMHTDKYKQTVLMWAAMFGHNDEVKKILATFVPLDEGALPTVTSDARAHNTALDRAVRYINAQDAAGRTALMYAILYGQNEAVKLLIPYCGSGVNLKDNQGYTALGYAAQKGNKELIKLLLGSGASIKVLAIKEVAEQNNDYLAASLLGQKRGQNIFGSLS
jgi:uncharacterized protein